MGSSSRLCWEDVGRPRPSAMPLVTVFHKKLQACFGTCQVSKASSKDVVSEDLYVDVADVP